MCRLFGLHAGRSPAAATFWLLSAPDSLAEQSRREPDGAGIGIYRHSGDDAGAPYVTKQPIAAWHDREFAYAARELTSTTFVAHVRYSTGGAPKPRNTHPFMQDDRLFAHNGALSGIDRLDDRLAMLQAADLVHGDTDSERLFALITAETRRADGDVSAGLIEAVTWISDNLPVLSLNLIVTTATDLWALRYPETHPLYVLTRTDARGSMRAHSARIRAHSDALARETVVIATEPMDADPGWRPMEPGELLHVDAGLACHSRTPFRNRPAHMLAVEDLSADAAAAQRA
ncbi:class II glutamine amidotransferase [Spelaeicoccus albus]|uniref:Glutamine amidotransferase n=1 Tax=Spelaeicoccus albus TaxID=1280376 RepID=A0A7Z0D437_9MICO|nr:class II glutamine amidotransferase [Spelaeicoccus albus]NYI68446.1 glutamine amidotransferase [Spelaeicoccus albus]